jgi:hypothetical protein
MGAQRRGRAVERKKFQTAIDMAQDLPHLFKPISDSPVLIGEEQDTFAQCEAAVETLKGAFWAAGKALQIIRDARLYRGTHKAFHDYCTERWGMNRQNADKLIRTWPIAEALYKKQSSAEVTQIGVKKLNQSQVWELVPVAESWDVDSATFVYDTVVEIDGQAVTAAVLKGAVGAVAALPKGDEFDREVAAERILDYVSSLSQSPLEKVPAQQPIEDQIAARASRAVQADWVRRLAAQDKRRAAAYLDEVQQRLDQLRKELLTTSA